MRATTISTEKKSMKSQMSYFLKCSLPFVFLLIGLLAVPLQMLDTDFSKIPGDLGDARFNNYILEHGYLYLTGQINNYWDAPFMYPATNIIALSDNLLGTVPLYSLFRVSGLDVETSFQSWILLMFALNFIFCFVALNRMTNDIVISTTGAYIFAFSIFFLSQANHVQVFPRFIIPFIFYWSWLYLKEKQLKYFIFSGLGIVYQFYCVIYLGFFTLLSLAFFYIAYKIIYKDKELINQFKNKSTLKKHILSIISFAILLLPLMLPYLSELGKSGYRSYSSIESTIPTIRSYFFSINSSYTWNFLSEHGVSKFEIWWCHQNFIGALPWIGILLIPVLLYNKNVAASNKQFIKFLALSLFLNIIFSLKIYNFSLYYLIFHLPGFGAMRSIDRIVNVEIIFFVWIFVFIMIELKNKFHNLKYLLLLLPLLAVFDNLVIAEKVIRFDKKYAQQRIVEMKTKISDALGDTPKPIAYIPVEMPEKYFEINIDVMLACQQLNIPCVNGYSGSAPAQLDDFIKKGTEEGLNKWLESNDIPDHQIIRVYEDEASLQATEKVYLQAANEKFVSVNFENGNILKANVSDVSSRETFSMLIISENKCAFISHDNYYICAELSDTGVLTATRIKRKNWETFRLIDLDSNKIALQADNKKFVSLDVATSKIIANGDTIGPNETFSILKHQTY